MVSELKNTTLLKPQNPSLKILVISLLTLLTLFISTFRIVFIKILCVLIILSILHYVYCHYTPYARKLNKFGGPPFVPLIGCWDVFRLQPKYIMNYNISPMRKPGVLWLGNVAGLVVHDLNIVQQVLTTTMEKADERLPIMKLIGRNSVLISDSDIWRPTRKLLCQGLKSNLYENFMEVFNEHSDTLLEVLDERNGEEFNVQSLMGKHASDIAFETLLDQGGESSLREEQGFYEAYEKILEIAFRQIHEPWMNNPIAWHFSGQAKAFTDGVRVLKSYICKDIPAKMQEWKAKSKMENDPKNMKIAHILYANWNNEEEIFQQLLTVLAAAIDNTDSTLSSVLFLIGNHLDVQEKLFEEISQIVGVDANNTITMEQVNSMRYLDMVIKETMRVMTPAPFIGRKTVEDTEVGKGLVIPKNTNVYIPIWFIHKNPEVYPEPEKFIPERFLPEVAEKRHPYAYLAFSQGPRNCFGQKYAMIEIKVTVAKILLKFEISSSKKLSDLKFVTSGPFTKVVGGVSISLKKRQS